MPATEPSPMTWTFRLKHQKTTVLLYVNPLQKFSSIKEDLLEALKEVNYPGELPASPSEIQLARLVVPNEPSKGFVLGEWEQRPILGDEENSAIEGIGKSKGKPKKKVTDDGDGVGANQCPKGAGLTDGAILAFRWGMQNDEDDIEMAEAENEGWDVTLPSYDETYQQEQPVDDDEEAEVDG
ncbi:hypothetical protein GQ43DRAFT_169868 [Delitschia confertaspora ATCC 74209]|uniref:Uncharacterized protein n=1 Tax=Delitschia confertaspora ATCC 74209 TaxID=1513339 RepID=A0A9P4JJB9_9PLEO|nr:hypothetical protein GQ43DRAFT_169868 [Delitschia confertaspora ATCC 74209]